MALGSLLLTAGCAFQTVPITLPKTATTGLRGGEGRRVVVAIPFADERSDRQRCGTQKNAYNMATADAICSEDPAVWIAGMLAQELRSAGFSVLDDSDQRPRSAVRIKGTLIQFFIEPVIGFTSGTLESDLHVKLTLSSESGLRADRSFYVKGTESALFGTHGEFQKAVDESVEQMLKEMVSAILSL